MDNPMSPFEKWRLETIPQVGFTPEIRELLAMAFEGGRQSVAEKQEPVAFDEEEFNAIAYAYRTCPVHEVKMVSERYQDLLNYVLSLKEKNK